MEMSASFSRSSRQTSEGSTHPVRGGRRMRSLRHALLVTWVAAAGACSTGKVTPDTSDDPPPEISLSVTALDPDEHTAKSTSAPPRSSKNLPATENTDIIIV